VRADGPAPGAAAADFEELLLHAQRQLENLYALDAQPPVTEFLIAERDSHAWPGDGSRTLVRQEGDEMALGVVLAPAVADALARDDPRRGLHRRNLGAFCTLTEEVSHFVLLLFCATRSRTVSQLELELQAEVDKYLCALALLSLRDEGALSARLKELLFREYHLVDGLTPERAERYHAASALAYRYCRFLEAEYLRAGRADDLRREARRFYRLGQAGKLERIATVQR
jgi:hypothetical protein